MCRPTDAKLSQLTLSWISQYRKMTEVKKKDKADCVMET